MKEIQKILKKKENNLKNFKKKEKNSKIFKKNLKILANN